VPKPNAKSRNQGVRFIEARVTFFLKGRPNREGAAEVEEPVNQDKRG